MDSIIEVQRQTHEEIERFERALYSVLSRPQNVHQTRLQNEHKASQILDRVTARLNALNNTYQDHDARKAEIDSLSSPNQQSDLSAFYSRLGKIQEHHHKYPDASADGFELELAAFMDEFGPEDLGEEEDPIANMFSGEESYGKYLDLYTNHTAYNNLKNIDRRLAYIHYLDALMLAQSGLVHRDLPTETRFSKDYERQVLHSTYDISLTLSFSYIRSLHTYLLSFLRRTQPLVDIDSRQRDAETAFGNLWETGDIHEWLESSKTQEGNNTEGIWCPACQKMYSKQTVYDAHLTSKKHIKAAAKQTTSEPPSNSNGPSSTSSSLPFSIVKDKHRSSALLTHLTTSLLVELVPILNDTKANVERRFSLTAREREQELEEQNRPPPPPTNNTSNGDAGGEEEEEEERIYNPLKLPLGWDGKPIPYWLYKLHGLGVEYRCEICSDHVYMGRKNFDRHFQESRHAFGMRALGLPNTKHFHEITRIEDALSLAEKLKQEGKHEIFEQETMEELEDDEGNVYNRKTYDDLKKQGLI
ncbi:hypothetical protein OF83DRAFT_1050217 [Amylostereum chailletii]|nr:hypothetical protein OF83DRAFT_1050217 [Amylostereum chailletii]